MSAVDLHAALQQHFNFSTFRPGQQAAIEHVLARRDTLVVMPTGAGKSLIYQLAGLLLPGTALVFSPLIALLKDQTDSLTRRGLAVIAVPPSTRRDFDPVSGLAQALAAQLKVPVLANVLIKTRLTQPQKEMRSLAQKQANVAGAFALRGTIRGQRVILIDDLYDSGATLDEAARVLARGGAASLIVLTLTKTIHSAA